MTTIYPTVRSDGRVTIRQDVREALDIEPGDTVVLEIKDVDKQEVSE